MWNNHTKNLKLFYYERDKGMEMNVVSVTLIGILSVILLVTGQTAFAQDLAVLSHRFDESRFSSEIIGEIMNNGTRTYDMYDIDIYANLRDSTGSLLVSQQGFIDAQTLSPGSSSAFNVFFLDEEIPENTSTYDLIVNDERLVVGQPLNEEFVSSSSGTSSSDGGGNNEDDDNDDNDNNNDNDNDNGDNTEELVILTNGCSGGAGYYANDPNPICYPINDNGELKTEPDPNTGTCTAIGCLWNPPAIGQYTVDDGYTYPEDATEKEKDEIDEQEQQEWEDAGRPGDESDGDSGESGGGELA